MGSLGVVVVTWNSAATIGACLASIPEGIPVVVVDNASDDPSLACAAAARPDAQLVRLEANVGFGAACNRGAQVLGARDVLLLNPDATLTPGTLERMAEVLETEAACGVVGPLILDEAGNLELSWGQDPSLRTEWRRRQEHGALPAIAGLEPVRVDWVTGACCLIRREAWDQAEGFDEGFFLYFEDLDLCRRIRRSGFDVRFEPEACARHLRGTSAAALGVHKEARYRASQLRYYRLHGRRLSLWGLRAYLIAKYAMALVRRPSYCSVYGQIIAWAVRGAETSPGGPGETAR